MKRFSFFFLLFCLSLTTAFVFASNKKFANSIDLYADKGGGAYVEITDGPQSFLELTTSNAGSPVQAQMRDRSGATYPLVHETGSGKVPVYSVTVW